MAVRILTITNLTNQVIPILYGAAATATSTSDVKHTLSGQLTIAPHKDVAIEESRLDLGQLEGLRRKKLISFVVS